MSKFSSRKPKDDSWGVEDVIADMKEKVLAGEQSPLVPVIGVIAIDKVIVDPKTGESEAVIVLRRIESITSIERIREAQKMILEQVAERRGEGTMLPFEEKDIIERAFGGMTGKTVGDQLQDDAETEIDAELDDDGRLRRHLVAAHSFDPGILTDEDWKPADAERSHEAEHAKDPADRAWPDHDPESRVWRRVDLTDMIGDAEEPEPDGEPETLFERDGAITDDPTPNPMIPEFDAGHAVDAESLNPQLDDPDEE